MSWGIDLHRPPSISELNTGIEGFLTAHRPSNSPNTTFPVLTQLLLVHQAQVAALRDGSNKSSRQTASAEQAIGCVVAAARERLVAARQPDGQDQLDSAEMLHLYYDKGWSIQSIKNNRRRSESVPTLRRRRLTAIAELSAILYEHEQAARADLRYALIAQLPPKQYDTVYGRQPAIVELAEHVRMASTHWLINVSGLGGIGKTTLMQAALRQMIDEMRVLNVAWIDVDVRDDSISAGTLFNNIVAQLAIELGLPPADPQRQTQQLQRFLKAVPHLIVIDNLEIDDHKGELSVRLSSLANPTKFILASRRRLKATQPIWHLPLYEIDQAAARSFVNNRAEQLGILPLAQASDALLARVQHTLGGHPHALRLFIQLAGYYDLDDVLVELESAETDEVDTLYAHIYQRVLEFQSDSAHQLLHAMRLVPSGGADDTYLATFCGLDKRHRWQAIRQLCDSSLLHQVRENERTLYQIHSLTDTYLGQLADDSPVTDAQTAEQILACCAQWQAQKAEITPANFNDQHPLLYRLVQVGLKRPEVDVWEAVVNLMLDLYFTIESTPYWREWLALHYMALRRVDSAEAYTRYRLYSRVGTYHLLDNNLERAVSANQTALELAEEIRDIKLMGRQHVHLCNAFARVNEWDRAIEHGQTGLDMFEELNLPSPYLLAALHTLGRCYFQAGRFQLSAESYQRATELQESEVSKIAMARSYMNWGGTLRYAEQYADALEKYKMAAHILANTDSYEDRIVRLLCFCTYYLDTEQLDDAQNIVDLPEYDYHQPGLRVELAGHIAISVGRYHMLQQQYALAAQCLEDAITMWESTTPSIHLVEAYALLSVAQPHVTNPSADYQSHANHLFNTIAAGDWKTALPTRHAATLGQKK